MREVLQWTSMNTTNSSNDWGGTPLWICWRVLRWKSQLIWMTKMRILEACCMCWMFCWGTPRFHHECAEHWNLWVLFWCFEVITSHFNFMMFAVNASQIQRQFLTAWHRYLSTSIWRSKSTPRFPAFFVGQTLVFLSLTRSEASFWEDHWCLKHSFHTIQLILSRALIFCKFCHVCKEECQSNTLLYMKIIWRICMDLLFRTLCWTSCFLIQQLVDGWRFHNCRSGQPWFGRLAAGV